jgi:uncharacterized membrane protein YjjP (DUF1212 family)
MTTSEITPCSDGLPESGQREITRLCVESGLLLMQHGAESALVENVAKRLGLGLGMDSVEIAISANALTLTTLNGGQCITTVRRNMDQGINMHIVTEVQRMMLMTEKKQLDLAGACVHLAQIKPQRYPKWMVAVMIGLSCACFARLMGADIISCALTAAASGTAMVVRQILARQHFNPLVNFACSAFVATSISCQSSIHSIGSNPTLVMAASVLLLVPGFPLINAVSDMVKGYVNTGVSRWTMATLLIMATSMGIILALTVWKVRPWL